MKAAALIGGVFAVMGWSVAAWLWFAKPAPSAGPTAPPKPGAAASSGTLYPAKGFAAVFNDWAAQPSLAGAAIGFCLLDENGSVVFASPLASTALCPASALKTVTTATALERLGPDFRFATTLSTYGPFLDGTVDGNLYLVGGRDPTFSTADLEAMVREAVSRGLKRVNGKVIVSDVTSFDGPVSDHWNWGDIGNAYGAGAFQLNLDHNRMNLRFKPGKNLGDKAKLVTLDAATADTRWIDDVRTAAPGSGDRVTVYSEPRGRIVRLRGTVPQGGDEFTVGAALPDPPARAREVLLERLRLAGVSVTEGDVRDSHDPNTTVLARHESAALPEIIDHLHRVSDNLEAQCLFHAIGTVANSDPAWIIRRHWKEKGVEHKGLRMIDGSGLARANMIRAVDLAEINHLARGGPSGPRFVQSLTAYLGGRVRSKLGAMSGVKTDVGFIRLDDGREMTFCLMANGLDPQLDFWPLRDQLLEGIGAN